MKLNNTILLAILITLLNSCTQEKQKESITEGGMKCGPGKCGASMVDGSAVLVKKKMNILNQLREDDTRRECVLNASSTKILYDCVRVEKTGRLSTKCDANNVKQKEIESMKCEAGKCGSGMEKSLPKKETSSMKCEVGKCGG
jgi:uncharacterized low-complexity protein